MSTQSLCKRFYRRYSQTRTGIVVTRSEPTSGLRKWSEAKWWQSSLYLPRSKPSFLTFRRLSNEQNAFTYIFQHGNGNKKPSDKLCRTIPLQITEFEGLVCGHIGARDRISTVHSIIETPSLAISSNVGRKLSILAFAKLNVHLCYNFTTPLTNHRLS